MPKILESLKWGRQALRLAKHVEELDPHRPAIMHIRHSERHTMKASTAYEAALTETGKQASLEFGAALPPDRAYRIMSTAITRSRSTAEYINRGILGGDGDSELLGVIPVTSLRDPERYRRDVIEKLDEDDEDERVRKLVYRWVLGHIPPSVIKPSLDFAYEAAAAMLKCINEAEPRDLVVWVSHDNWIAPMLMHWLGIYSWEKIWFLDGFMLQFYDDHMTLFFKGRTMKAEYPYWWGR